MIPFLDLKAASDELHDELQAALERVLSSGWYVLGAEVEAFEQAYASHCEASHCIGVANGLDALYLALNAMDVGPGDEVIVPSNTYIACWLAVSMCGATPVPVEPDESTHNLDPNRVEAAITPRTRVIMPVHLYGLPAELDPILSIAKRRGLRVLEDAAQAHGARYKGRPIGGHSDAVAWSFYPGKNMGALGDGGAVTTNDPTIADRVRMLRNYGSHRKYVNEVRGVNSRLDEIQAAVLAVKLGHLADWNARRARLAAYYRDALAGTELVLPAEPADITPAWHLFVVRHPRRDALAAALAERKIGTLIHYPIPPHLQKAYADLGLGAGAYPIAERLADEVLSLPLWPQMQTEQVDAVVAALKTALAEAT